MMTRIYIPITEYGRNRSGEKGVKKYENDLAG